MSASPVHPLALRAAAAASTSIIRGAVATSAITTTGNATAIIRHSAAALLHRHHHQPRHPHRPPHPPRAAFHSLARPSLAAAARTAEAPTTTIATAAPPSPSASPPPPVPSPAAVSGASTASSAAGAAPTQWRVFGVAVNPQHPLQLSLTAVYGVGRFRAREICGQLGLNPQAVTASLGARWDALRLHIEGRYPPRHLAEKVEAANILQKVRIGCYQGIRHAQALPVRGQRTQTNAKTQRKMGRHRQAVFAIPLYNKKKPPPAGVRPVLTTAAQQHEAGSGSQQQQGQQSGQGRQQKK